MRLKDYDYSNPGLYFVTICTEDRRYYFGRMNNEIMELSDTGKIANQCWLEIPKHFPCVKLEKYAIMPNHIHGIIRINGDSVESEDVVGAENFQPLLAANVFQHMIPRSLSSVVKGFKIGVTKWCRQNNKDFIWQRSFYDHIIRTEKSYIKIQNYIINNPANWQTDIENREFCKMFSEKEREWHYRQLVMER